MLTIATASVRAVTFSRRAGRQRVVPVVFHCCGMRGGGGRGGRARHRPSVASHAEFEASGSVAALTGGGRRPAQLREDLQLITSTGPAR